MPFDPEYQELYELFSDEAGETLQALEDALLELEKGFRRGEPLNLALLSSHLRPLHTLKGNAGMIGLSTWSKLIHSLEAEIKGGKVLTLPELEIRLKVVEALKGSLKWARKGEEPGGLAEWLKRLEQGEPLEGTGEQREEGEGLPRAKRSRRKKAEAGEAPRIPQETSLEHEGERVGEPRLREERSEELFVRVRGRRLDELQEDVGDLLLSFTALKDRLVRELLPQAPSGIRREVGDLLEELEGEVRRVRNHTVNLRLTPLTQVLRRAPLIVRDAARRSGKEVEVVVEGETTEADKTVVEMVEEVLVHLLRNAVDHGIERPEVREAQGKRRHGTVRVEAKALGEEIVIAVEDDGAGISLERVRRRAVELGLVSQEEAEAADPKTVLSWLFLSGFSTRTEATELSGRGVGLDAVLHRVRALGGHMDVESQEGRGTTFSLYIPVSTQMADLILGSCGPICVGFPLHRLVETGRYDARALRSPGGVEQYLLREEWLPVVDLHRLLFGKEEERRYFVVLNSSPRSLIPLHGLMGKAQGVLRTLKEPLLRASPFYAATMLGNGELTPVVDPDLALRFQQVVRKGGGR